MHSKNHLNIDFENDWTIKELNYATVKKKKIILIKLDDAPLENLFLFEYGSKNYISATDDIQRNKLIKDLGRLLKVEVSEKQPVSQPEQNLKPETQQTPQKEKTPADEVSPNSKLISRIIRSLRRVPVMICINTALAICVFLFFFHKPDSRLAATDDYRGYDYVDMGLSVSWATCNLGASRPQKRGNLYAWQENDVVKAKRDGEWRMPTVEEFNELLTQCDWKWTTVHGVYGYLITSKKEGYTNRSIFLPTTGYKGADLIRKEKKEVGFYWTNVIDSFNSAKAKYLYLDYDVYRINSGEQIIKQSIRPVCPLPGKMN
jgi:hypothetical protein